MFKQRSLALKISFFISAVMVFSLFVFAAVFIFSERTKVSQDILRSGRLFAQYASASIAKHYTQYYTRTSDEEFITFADLVERELLNNPDVFHVTLLSVNGRVLFDRDEIPAGKRYEGDIRVTEDEELLKRIKQDIVTSRKLQNTDGEPIIEIVAPILETEGSHVLSARYLLTYQSLNARMAEVYQQIVMTVVPLMIGAILISIPFSIAIVGPIRALTDATKTIREGKLDVEIKKQSNDEIGQLSESFNLMAQELKQSRDQIEQYNKTLEQKIADKTSELKDKVEDLERTQKLMVDREQRMVELKKELEALKQRSVTS